MRRNGRGELIVLIRAKDSLVFGRVQGILVSNDASAMQQFARAVP
jgi:hypothetical protein